MDIKPASFGIVPNTETDVTRNFIELFKFLKETPGHKHVVLEAGVYQLSYKFATREVMYVTNTVAEAEQAIPTRVIALLMRDIVDLQLDGEGAIFMINGMMTNLVIDNCENVVINGIAIDSTRPTISQMEVVERKAFSATIKIHRDSWYKVEKGKLFFYSPNFCANAKKEYSKSWANVVYDKKDPDIIRRTHRNPFLGALKFVDLGDDFVKIVYFAPNTIRKGEVFQVHCIARKEVGIFINRSKNITLQNVKEHANHSHAIVAQCSHDLTFDKITLAPRGETERNSSSQTDFVHIALCSGLFTLKDSFFQGAFDDALNVHGFHFQIKSIKGSELVVKFMHPQAYGFNPFDKGDIIEYIDSKTLLSFGETAEVISSEMLDKYCVKLTIDKAVSSKIGVGQSIENISKCPDVEVSGNYFSRVTTRGILLTTRGKINVVNNTFFKTQMSGILVSDDAKSWYESGMVKNLTIEGNKFIDCEEQAILVLPENGFNTEPVHSGIKIVNNDFHMNGSRAIYMRCVSDSEIVGNKFVGSTGNNALIKVSCSKGVKIEKNSLEETHKIVDKD